MTTYELSKASILMEGLSFFLVTIDLYGKNRLAALEEQLKTFQLLPALIRMYKIITPRITLKRVSITIGCALLLWLISYVIYDVIDSNDFLQVIAACMLLVLVLSGIVAISVVFIYVLILPFHLIIFIAKFLLKLAPIDGLMLLIGTLLFLASKVISYILV